MQPMAGSTGCLFQRGSDCILSRLTHWTLEDGQGQADQQGRVMQAEPPTAR